MEGYFQAAALVLVAVILTLTLGSQGRSMAVLLSLAVCSMLLILGMVYLQPVIALVERLQQMARLDGDMLRILLKCVGVSVVSEVAVLICSDSGNSAMGKALQMLTTLVVLWLGIPVFTALMDLVQKILGEMG